MDGRLLNQRYKRRTTALATLLAIAALFFGGVLLYQLAQLRLTGVEYSYQAAERSDSLARLHQAIGYGGFIHNYKNYLLRQDPQYLSLLEEDIKRTFSALKVYRRQPLTDAEYKALDALQHTFQQYTANTYVIEQAHRDGAAVQDLDRQVKISDREAISALTLLKNANDRFNAEQRENLRDQVNFIINLMLIGLISLPLIAGWAYRHIGLLERLVKHIAEKQKIQRKLEQTTAEASRARRTGERYKYLAYRCTLTQIPNRQAFDEAAAEVIARTQSGADKFALLYVDVDDFKTINDNHGHQVGDQVLQEIARRLERVLREEDLVARIGGDEFAILAISHGSQAATEQLAERILIALREPFDHIKPGLLVSCSLGGAIGPDHGGDIDTLLRVADTRMYEVKNSGKDGVMLG